ncbi:MAG: DUF3160 domain-containing protein [Fimbriimonadaceae bacterium]
MVKHSCVGFLVLVAGVACSQGFDSIKAFNLATFKKSVPMVAEHTQLLNKNGFVVAPAPGMIQMHYVFDENDYQNIPSIITIDVPMHLYHILFDATLRTVESETLFPKATALTKQMILATTKQYVTAPTAQLKAANLSVLAYFGVADRLFGATTSLPKEASAIVDRELALIRAHSGYVQGAIFPHELDYTQFIPRGHYTRSPRLTRYFLGMMWFGLAPFSLKTNTGAPDDGQILRALVLSSAFEASKSAALWNAVYEPTTLFAGTVNSLTPQMIGAAKRKVLGNKPITDSKSYSALLAELDRMNPSLYKPAMILRTNTPGSLQLRFMPQRGLTDGFAISRLTGEDRPLPSALDVFATLGVPRAADILDSSPAEYNPRGWSEYGPRRTELKTYFAGLPASYWQRNLYDAWLETVKVAAIRPKHEVPLFMQAKAWADKSLTTGLASYAELRHDTILYGEQTAVEMGDGEEEQPYVRQYVEPNVPVYDRLAWMTKEMQAGLAKYNLLTPAVKEDLKSYSEFLKLLRSAVDSQLAGKTLGKATHEKLRKIGGNIEDMTTTLLLRGLAHQTLTTKDRDMALVADIHSADPLALEIASGHADDLIALVPIEGKTYLARGPVYSFYEFTVPMSGRLSDEAWKQMLEDGKQPPRPKWTSTYRATKPARESYD